ncbi:MAG: glycosyltransferase family 2 protein [Clostridia bacterium]|jgi:glucosyltransferase|nr:glycosyltransferase family 2 protein [Clostridia bacterium]
MKKVSIIVPAYNEEEVLEIFYKETKKVLEEITDKYDYELIFVDDGSKDNTLDVLKNMHKVDEKINIISFSRNFGKEAGIYAGLSASNGDFAVIMDADLQNEPKVIIEMLKYIEEGYDTVTTIRNRKKEPKVKSFFAKTFYRLMQGANNIEIKEGSQDFRLMTRQVVDAILQLKEYNRFSKGIFSWVGFKTKYIEVENKERVAGKTKWSFKGLTKYAIEGITSFTVKPLRIATISGIIISIVSLILAIQIVIQTLISGKDVPGYASTITSVLFIGGIQLVTIGILSEYVGKIYLEIKGRPQYIIKEEILGDKIDHENIK